MTDTKHSEALQLADQVELRAEQATNAAAFQVFTKAVAMIRQQDADLEVMRASYAAARLEIESLMEDCKPKLAEAWNRRTPQPTQAQEPLTDAQIAEMMRDTWGCASIAPRHAPEFARAVERAHGIKGGPQTADPSLEDLL